MSEAADPAALDLRVLTPGLGAEEVAAVTTVVAAMLEAQRDAAALAAVPVPSGWARSHGPTRPTERGPGVWRRSLL